jgi:hypothetical protein
VIAHLDADSLGFLLCSSKCQDSSQVRACQAMLLKQPPDLNPSNLSSLPWNPENRLYKLCISFLTGKVKTWDPTNRVTPLISLILLVLSLSSMIHKLEGGNCILDCRLVKQFTVYSVKFQRNFGEVTYFTLLFRIMLV